MNAGKNNTRPSLRVFIKMLNYIYHLELYTKKSNNHEDSHNLKLKKDTDSLEISQSVSPLSSQKDSF